LYLANSLAPVISEPDLYMLLTFQVPNLLSLYHCLGHKVPVQFQVMCLCFVSLPVFTLRSCQNLPQPPSRWTTPFFFLSATIYPIYSKLPSILEAVSSSTAQAHAMLWWQGPPYHFLKWCWYLKCRFLQQFILHLYGCRPVNILFIHVI
jgi:hypothetical protein